MLNLSNASRLFYPGFLPSNRAKMMNEKKGKGYKLNVSEEERQRRRENMIRINKERKGQNTTLNKKRDDKGRFLSK